ncbi:ubiquitin carboxyl-terminal hydrolase, partial [Reticulomyxa filosa]
SNSKRQKEKEKKKGKEKEKEKGKDKGKGKGKEKRQDDDSANDNDNDDDNDNDNDNDNEMTMTMTMTMTITMTITMIMIMIVLMQMKRTTATAKDKGKKKEDSEHEDASEAKNKYTANTNHQKKTTDAIYSQKSEDTTSSTTTTQTLPKEEKQKEKEDKPNSSNTISGPFSNQTSTIQTDNTLYQKQSTTTQNFAFNGSNPRFFFFFFWGETKYGDKGAEKFFIYSPVPFAGNGHTTNGFSNFSPSQPYHQSQPTPQVTQISGKWYHYDEKKGYWLEVLPFLQPKFFNAYSSSVHMAGAQDPRLCHTMFELNGCQYGVQFDYSKSVPSGIQYVIGEPAKTRFLIFANPIGGLINGISVDTSTK